MQPLRIIAGAEVDVLAGEGRHRVGGAFRPGGDGGVVQIAQPGRLGKFMGEVIHMANGPCNLALNRHNTRLEI
ncbi:hypothetical protein D3C81_1017460 [compost metagenome]